MGAVFLMHMTNKEKLKMCEALYSKIEGLANLVNNHLKLS